VREALPSPLPCAECQDCECRLDCRFDGAATDPCDRGLHSFPFPLT